MTTFCVFLFMAEAVIIELFENQRSARDGWLPDSKKPWTLKTLEACCPPEDIPLPSSGEWAWSTNWKLRCPGGIYSDNEGWEYASRYARFQVPDRQPKSKPLPHDLCRRRLWHRTMKKESKIRVEDFEKTIPAIQKGISSISETRLHLTELLNSRRDFKYSYDAVGGSRSEGPDESLSQNDWLVKLETVISAASKGLSDLNNVLEGIENFMSQQHSQVMQNEKIERAKLKEARRSQQRHNKRLLESGGSASYNRSSSFNEDNDDDEDNDDNTVATTSTANTLDTPLFESRLLVLRKLKKDISREQGLLLQVRQNAQAISKAPPASTPPPHGPHYSNSGAGDSISSNNTNNATSSTPTAIATATAASTTSAPTYLRSQKSATRAGGSMTKPLTTASSNSTKCTWTAAMVKGGKADTFNPSLLTTYVGSSSSSRKNPSMKGEADINMRNSSMKPTSSTYKESTEVTTTAGSCSLVSGGTSIKSPPPAFSSIDETTPPGKAVSGGTTSTANCSSNKCYATSHTGSGGAALSLNPFYGDNDEEDGEDGTFIDRDHFQSTVLQKLRPLDMQADMEAYAEERMEGISRVHKDLATINLLFTDLAHLVAQQQGNIDTISKSAETSRSRAENALSNIEQASGTAAAPGNHKCTIS